LIESAIAPVMCSVTLALHRQVAVAEVSISSSSR
jgi:hypothetical protein